MPRLNGLSEHTGLTSDDVLRELWRIATTATSGHTRVAALVWVGKHLGMFRQNVQVSRELPVIRITCVEHVNSK